MFPNDSNLESEFTFETPGNSLPDALPFHILFLGDWSGNAVRANLAGRRPIVIDRDNFDDVMQRLNVGLELDFHGDGSDVLPIRFTELDDFHPDNLFRQVSVFSDLRDVRRRLLNTDSFNSAANEVRSWFKLADEKTPPDGRNEINLNEVSNVDSNDLLDMILTQPSPSSGSAKTQTGGSSDLARLVSKIVSPHLIKVDENEQSKLVAAVDDSIGELMRMILHHQEFQALESAWRGLYFLTRRLETDVDLKVYILDVSKAELLDNLKSISDLTESVFYRWLVRDTMGTSGGEPWAVIGGNYSFGVDVEDVAGLIRLGKLAAAANAPFVSHIRPEMFGIRSFASDSDLSFADSTTVGKLWNAARNVPESGYIGLSPMRFLARLPYGSRTDSTETFSFEEFTGDIDHEQYLWSNPSFICSLLLGQSFRLYSWEMGGSLQRDVDKLPIVVYQKDGEAKTKPCAEVQLTENLAEKILEQGLIPLISFRDSDRVKIGRFQSISANLKNLCGRWAR